MKQDQTDSYDQSKQTQGQFPELTRVPALALPQGRCHMGPVQPIYGHDLQAQPFHAAELEHFPKATFNLLSNPLDPHIDRAVTTLGDLGVMADVFHLRQLPLKYLDQAHQMAYLVHKQDHIQRDQGLLHLAK